VFAGKLTPASVTEKNLLIVRPQQVSRIRFRLWAIDRPRSGRPCSAGFSVYNREQRSLLLDLATGPGREIFRELVRSSDVVVDNYRAGVLQRLGIDHACLSAVSPHISSVSISAFGPGRWLDMPGLVASAPGQAPQPGEHTDAILGQTGTGTAGG
jgi:crotonobetainyl-CoA:carnitine CoA-transferase CaiB-like acyl-CoA transferase